MARSRMINKRLINKDKFLQLPGTTQLLYFHLCLNADDDGFLDNALTIIRQLPTTIEDFKTLIEKEYVLMLDEDLYVITHWRIHNRLDKCHYRATNYISFMKKIFMDENEVYTLGEGINLYEYQVNRQFIKVLNATEVPMIEDDAKKKISEPENELVNNSNCSQNELNEKSNCVQNELKKNSICTQNEQENSSECSQNELKMNSSSVQNEPQDNSGKDNSGKDSKVNVTNSNQDIRLFLNSHNLGSLDERFIKKMKPFFEENNKDETDCYSYCEYVYNYLAAKKDTVDVKLYYSVFFEPDVLTKFYRAHPKKTGKVVPITEKWPVICPVCNNFHNASGYSENCALNMNDMDSAEAIENAKRFNNMTEADKIKEINSFFKAAFSNKKL